MAPQREAFMRFRSLLMLLVATTAIFSLSVRGEPPKPPRFINRGDHVVDTKTGLLWQKDGDASGKLNYHQAAEYAEKLRLGRMKGWRVPTRDELAGIFPATERSFTDTKYAKDPAGPDQMNSYWTSELDPGRDDYAFVYQWYRDGAPNNCFASKNFVYVRCVHDPVKRR